MIGLDRFHKRVHLAETVDEDGRQITPDRWLPYDTLVVTPSLQTTKDDNIFAIGDCSYCVLPGDTSPLPPRAQTAHQQSSHLVKQLQRRVAGETTLAP